MPLAHPSLAKYLFLDLDGTLTDSSEGITRGVLYTLERFGIHEDNTAKLLYFIGPPLYRSFMEHYGFSKEKAYEAVAVFQEYYADRGAFENRPYPGIPELLHSWAEQGRKLILATSKPEVHARRILEHFGMAKDFRLIAGSDIAETRVEKESVLAYALERLGLQTTENALMIGDRSHDVLGAAKHSMPTLGVLYGFGTREELEEAGAAWIARDVPELAALLETCPPRSASAPASH